MKLKDDSFNIFIGHMSTTLQELEIHSDIIEDILILFEKERKLICN